MTPRPITAHWTGRRYEVPPSETRTGTVWYSANGTHWRDAEYDMLTGDFDKCEIRLVGGPVDGATVLAD